jgi:type III pantothenate kinase
MLLAIDIGNTSIKFGIFEGDSLIRKFVIPTRLDHTPTEIKEAVSDDLHEEFNAVIACSVVPETNAAVAGFVSHFLGRETRFIEANDDFGLVFGFPVDGTGSDRLVNASAAADKYGRPVIVCSLGTATTIDVVSRNGEYLGGLIAPGMSTAAKALRLLTSKLPEVEIAEPANVIAVSTIAAIRSGIFYSQIGLLETAVRHIKAEIGEDARVVATGGFAHLIANKCRSVDVVDGDLTLEGLKMLYSRRLAV